MEIPNLPSLLSSKNIELIERITNTSEKYCLNLLHDRNGNLILILDPIYEQFLTIAKELTESKELSKYYQIDKDTENHRVYQKTPFRLHIGFHEFFSNLPLTKLISIQLEGDLFFGRIFFCDILPNIGSHGTSTFIFVDSAKDTMVGFTNNLYKLFKEKFPKHESMLGVPLSIFFSPTPREYHERANPEFNLSHLNQFLKVQENDFSRLPDPALTIMPFDDGLMLTNDGWHWKNDSNETQYITLSSMVDTLDNDFFLELHYQNHYGNGPFLVLGEKYVREDHLPDNNGYLVGRSAVSENEIQIKCNGFICHTAPIVSHSLSTTKICLCKINQSIILYADEMRIIQYNDSAFISNRMAYLSIGLRSGYSCTLKKSTLGVRKMVSKLARVTGEKSHIIQMHTPNKEHFILERFFLAALSRYPFQNIAGYFMYDVTTMINRIETLDTRVRSHIRREQKLERLLKRFEATESDFISVSPIMAEIKEKAKTVAQTNATVLIEGATGTGKEVLAQYIHDLSPRRERSCIKVDCSTIPSNLIESHLFGHEKGAFTGAIDRTIGLLEQSEGGTLFLDEAGNLTLETQAKLLRFLNDLTFTRVGGSQSLCVDTRIIVASNVPLYEKVKQGLFREDLYYRVNVITLTLPTLSQRKEEIPVLCSHFLAKYNREFKKSVKEFSSSAINKMIHHSWPGNIRELKNVVQRAVLFSNKETITEELIVFEGRKKVATGRERSNSPFLLEHTDDKEVIQLLAKYYGRITPTAKALGMARPTLYKYLKQKQIDVTRFRKGFRSGT
ncbi:MAG: sigma-54-dependent Fis family transcriptional regulator [Fibrobacteres bacterium]|nr:sigma-54-dependent Fis family transcriptional regulator [Fibrobacterota bacterium]